MADARLLERLAAELSLPLASVEATAALLAEGGTAPFLARYRRERTGGLGEPEIRALASAVRQAHALEQRRARILKDLEAQGQLTPEVRAQVEACTQHTELEDLHLTHRGHRRTRGMLARERGLEPLAQAIAAQAPGSPSLEAMAAPFVSTERGVRDVAAALEGAQHIIAESVASHQGIRQELRRLFAEAGAVRARVVESRTGEHSKYETYYDFSEPAGAIPSHRVLAIRRGEKEGWLKVSIEADRERALQILRQAMVTAPATPMGTVVETAIADAYDRLLAPALEAELRAEMKRRADAEAIGIFARNLRGLLLQPPVGPRRTLGIDSSSRAGCHVAVVDEQGKRLEHAAIAPLAREPQRPKPAPRAPAPAAPAPAEAPAPPAPAETAPPQAPAASAEAPAAPAPAEPPPAAPAPAEAPPVAPSAPGPTPEEARATLRALIEKHGVAAIAIGNSHVAHEIDHFVRDLLRQMPDRRIVRSVVTDAGATAYANSRAARDEFPDLAAAARCAVAIARRLQDPLTELAQVDPKTIGVGQYQHDVNQQALHDGLQAVVESCVNWVGVDANRAPASLLARVAGVGRGIARDLVAWRTEHGPFRSRAQLREVPRFDEARFTQAAGFLRVSGGEQPLDATGIHPERYGLVARIAADAGTSVAALLGNREAIEGIDFPRYADADAGEPTLADIRRELLHPARDPRGVFRQTEAHESVHSLEDLKPGMLLEGKVTNVTNFGAFVDIGLSEDGLVHVSHLARRYVTDPNDVVKVGHVVRVKVLSVDMGRRRIALSMKDALPPRPKPRPKSQAEGERQGAPEARKPQGTQGRKPAEPAKPAKPKRDPFAKATPEDIARLIAHFQSR